MPVQKVVLKPGVNRENTRYTSEGGWYECDKVRFRQGNPEKIGGWIRYNGDHYLGVCRSLFAWASLSGTTYLGVGTSAKYYVEFGSVFNDITPLRATETLGSNPFATTDGSSTVTVTDSAGGFSVGDAVDFSGASTVNGLDLNGEFLIQSVPTSTTYTITANGTANATGSGGGASVTAEYAIAAGPTFVKPAVGWGGGAYGFGPWGEGAGVKESLRVWNHSNFGEDLIFGPRTGELYLWDSSASPLARGTKLADESGASDVPTTHNLLLVSDVSRFVMCFGCNPLGETDSDPMLIRWSDQEDSVNWTPAATNQAGSIRLSRGSQIVAVKQARQEILVWTDVALYSMQYVGPDAVWSVQLIAENISIASSDCVAYTNGTAYWMGREKFYMYNGRTQPLSCDLRKFIFNDLNQIQYPQVFAGNVEQFHEVWWFYCEENSLTITNYVVYNYLEGIWYYGTLGRTAWLDAGLLNRPVGATYNENIVLHESGVDNEETASPQPIHAFIESAQFDIDDGDRFSFIRRLLPDVSFEGSTATAPRVTMTLQPLRGSGSGYRNPLSVGGESSATTTRTVSVPVEEYTNQLFIRVRGRQLSIKIESSALGVQWQAGQQRIDIRPDGRK